MDDERVAGLPLLHLVGRSIALRVALVVTVPPVGGGLHHDGAAPVAHRIDDLAHRRRGGNDVVAVDRHVVEPVAGGPVLEGGAVLVGRGGELGVPVVLAEEHDGQLPHRGQVQRLVERPLGHGSVAEERNGDRPVIAQPAGRRRAHGDGQAGGDDPVGAEDAEVRIGDVHRTAPPPVGARVLGHQLGEHAERIEALGEAVAVAPVGRGDHVGRSQRPARPHRRGLLAHRQVHEAGDLAVPVQVGDPCLEPTDQQHAPVHLEEVVVREHERGTVLVGTRPGRAMSEPIEIPRSFPRGGEVRDKRVVLTGASRGLGRVLAHAFSQAGAWVALVARTEAALKETAAELPGPSLVCPGDVTDAEFNQAVAEATGAEWGGVDVWICNAGISPVLAGPLETDPSVWREILDVNLTGAFLGARAAARVMRDGGRLIFTGSVLGERPARGSSPTAPRRPGSSGWRRVLRSISHRRVSP